MPRTDKADADAAIYPLLEELDKVTELLEMMDELGIESRADAERRVAELNGELDRRGGA